MSTRYSWGENWATVGFYSTRLNPILERPQKQIRTLQAPGETRAYKIKPFYRARITRANFDYRDRRLTDFSHSALVAKDNIMASVGNEATFREGENNSLRCDFISLSLSWRFPSSMLLYLLEHTTKQ